MGPRQTEYELREVEAYADTPPVERYAIDILFVHFVRLNMEPRRRIERRSLNYKNSASPQCLQGIYRIDSTIGQKSKARRIRAGLFP